jgi:uncharacterized membrane protein
VGVRLGAPLLSARWPAGMTEAIEDLQRRVAALTTEARARARAYQRSTWIRFVGVFFPIPFVVVLFRLNFDAWAYYVAGALFILSAAVLYTIDSAASDKVDAAAKAAEKAEEAYDKALRRELKLR